MGLLRFYRLSEVSEMLFEISRYAIDSSKGGDRLYNSGLLATSVGWAAVCGVASPEVAPNPLPDGF